MYVEEDHVLKMLRNINHGDIVRCDVLEIMDTLKAINTDNGAGLDQGEYLSLKIELWAAYYVCYLPLWYLWYLPSKLMETIIIPIVKDRKGLITDKDNYQAIAVTSVASKRLELLILEHIREYLYTECNHFGFKAKHGSGMCLFTLKQIDHINHL